MFCILLGYPIPWPCLPRFNVVPAETENVQSPAGAAWNGGGVIEITVFGGQKRHFSAIL
jgi:hypothetical protein